MWFIPLLAVFLACLFVFIYSVGRIFLRSTTSTKSTLSQNNSLQNSSAKRERVAPIVPSVPVVDPEEEISVPQEVQDMDASQTDSSTQGTVDICPSTTVAVKIKKPSRRIASTPYKQGLQRCKRSDIFPCAWEDKKAGVIKQYWLMGAEGPITRGVYDMGGNLMSETIATLNGTVTSYSEGNTTWYFQSGVLVKIRTSPYDNCNLNDWFFIREDGKQDVCQCVYTTQDCCARSPYREGMERSYCELFPSDKDFCK